MDVDTLNALPVLAETNISVIRASDVLAYKTKRPVQFPFVDQRSLFSRWRLCHQEVRFNQRFSEDVYLRVEPIEDGDDVVDYAVVMRRMPSDRRLSALVASADAEPCVVAVARAIARVHVIASRSPSVTSMGTYDAVRELWRLSLDDLGAFEASIVDPARLLEVRCLAERYLGGRQALFDARVASRQIVDGHGDLLADDIYCLDDGPRLLDCLEFDRQFRCGDVLVDIAFLAMDLERLGAESLARRFVAAYDEFTDEHHPESLIAHYVAYRAVVRAKVLAYRARAGADGAAAVSHQLLELAARHLRIADIRLVVIGGLPGTGKTTLAEAMSARTGWAVVSSDAIRRELTGARAGPHAYGEGSHAPAVTSATYETLFDRATIALSRGESVIVDASFSDDRWRRAARETAAATSSTLVELCCELPRADAIKRMDRRLRSQVDTSHVLSDATPEIASAMASDFARWPTATRVETDCDLVDLVSQSLVAAGLPSSVGLP
jgi:uncharacterized protein